MLPSVSASTAWFARIGLLRAPLADARRPPCPPGPSRRSPGTGPSSSRSARPSERPSSTPFIPSGDQSSVFLRKLARQRVGPEPLARPFRIPAIKPGQVGHDPGLHGCRVVRVEGLGSAVTTGTAQASSVSRRAGSSRRSSSRASTSAFLSQAFKPADRLADRPGRERVRIAQRRVQRGRGRGIAQPAERRSPPRAGPPASRSFRSGTSCWRAARHREFPPTAPPGGALAASGRPAPPRSPAEPRAADRVERPEGVQPTRSPARGLSAARRGAEPPPAPCAARIRCDSSRTARAGWSSDSSRIARSIRRFGRGADTVGSGPV